MWALCGRGTPGVGEGIMELSMDADTLRDAGALYRRVSSLHSDAVGQECWGDVEELRNLMVDIEQFIAGEKTDVTIEDLRAQVSREE